ncbi:hypothetical protein T02_10607 [Trichinella nativa]|uniref:Uncharacterized protein n=1 Tax=Trichinella nativa TaxID=6335 RepID=A0A0V1L9R1_9BILA|nr:hypothetical protein T02_10607 [Trichinella nativa]
MFVLFWGSSEPVVQNDRHAILQGEFLPPQTVGGMRHREEHADRWGQASGRGSTVLDQRSVCFIESDGQPSGHIVSLASVAFYVGQAVVDTGLLDTLPGRPGFLAGCLDRSKKPKCFHFFPLPTAAASTVTTVINNFIPSWKWNNQSGNNEVGGSVKRLLTKREHTRKAERPAGQSGRPIVLERVLAFCSRLPATLGTSP